MVANRVAEAFSYCEKPSLLSLAFLHNNEKRDINVILAIKIRIKNANFIFYQFIS